MSLLAETGTDLNSVAALVWLGCGLMVAAIGYLVWDALRDS